MNHSSAYTTARSLLSSATAPAALAALAALTGAGCDSPDTFLPFQQFGGPAGVITGAVTYAGPLPCTQGGRIVGAAVLLIFDVRLLPPPEGLGTSAASIAVVPGEKLFAGIKDQLEFDPGGALLCPTKRYNVGSSPGASVTVSADFAVAPLAAGQYQIRGFYDRDGDFDPGFSISKLPTAGDVGGGAIENASAVLLGQAPRYRVLTLGEPDANGALIMPTQGDIIEGVPVTLGLELPLERPVFYPKSVADPELDEEKKNKDPLKVTIPSDFQLETFSVMDLVGTENSLLKVRFGAGVDPEEAETASESPFNLTVNPPAPFFFTRQDANFDGKLDAGDHIAETALVPALYPISIFSKLSPASDLVAQPRPVVVMQGLTLYKSLIATGTLGMQAGPIAIPDMEVTVGLRPAAVCLDPTDTKKPGLLVVTHPTDKKGNILVSDEEGVKAALGLQFKRPIEIAIGCIPEGRYAMNLIYPTGQAWTVPNEAGICSPLEAASADGKTCGTRARLASQDAVITVGPPTDADYCASAPSAAAIKESCF